MKKIINKLFAGSLLAGMMLVSSCAGDYLDTAPTDSTGATDAVGTTANAMKALNGIAKIMTTQHSYFGGGFAGENNIMIQYESYPSENYNYNYYASGWSPIFNQEFHTRTNSIYDAYAWYYYYPIAGLPFMSRSRPLPQRVVPRCILQAVPSAALMYCRPSP